jgi:hypothetical protein
MSLEFYAATKSGKVYKVSYGIKSLFDKMAEFVGVQKKSNWFIEKDGEWQQVVGLQKSKKHDDSGNILQSQIDDSSMALIRGQFMGRVIKYIPLSAEYVETTMEIFNPLCPATAMVEDFGMWAQYEEFLRKTKGRDLKTGTLG